LGLSERLTTPRRKKKEDCFQMLHRASDLTLVGKYEGKISRGKRECRWEDNIRMDLREIGWEGVGWMHLDHDRD